MKKKSKKHSKIKLKIKALLASKKAKIAAIALGSAAVISGASQSLRKTGILNGCSRAAKLFIEGNGLPLEVSCVFKNGRLVVKAESPLLPGALLIDVDSGSRISD